MADITTYGLTAVTTVVDGDLLTVTDVSDTAQSANGSTRKVTLANLLNYIQGAWDGELAEFTGIGIGKTGAADKIMFDNAATIDVDDEDLTIDCGTDKTLVLNTVVYGEEIITALSCKLQGTNDPDFAQWKDNGGASTGIFTYWFDAAAEEEVFFCVKLPTGYKEAGDIVPIIRWTPATTADGTPANQEVEWGLEYVWVDHGETAAANTSIVYGNNHLPADADVVAGRQYSTVLTTLTGTGKAINSILMCRLFRAATDADDNYEHDAGLLSVGFRYPIDTIGSRTATAK